MDVAHRALRRCSEVGLHQDSEAPIENVGVQAAVRRLTVVSASVLTTVPPPHPAWIVPAPFRICVFVRVFSLLFFPWPAKPLENSESMRCLNSLMFDD